MATLYITKTGFRFPYNKWTDGSTMQNLQFLEAQLSQYLHSHEDDGTTLWVTPQGFRMPYKKTRDNLEENIKFVEVQLEKYLHDHFVDTTTSTEASEVLTDGGMEAMSTLEDTNGGTFQEVMKNSTFGRASLSTANPRGGSNHVRAELNELSANIYFGSDEVTDSSRTFPYLPVSTGDEVTFGAYAYIHSSQETPVFNLRATALEVSGGVVQNSAGVVSVAKSPTEDTYGFVQETYTVVDVGAMNVNGLYCWFQIGTTVNGNTARVDLDDFSINAETEVESDSTLFILEQGFRFPYGWEKDGDININMKFLETEISKYLHKHEVGV